MKKLLVITILTSLIGLGACSKSDERKAEATKVEATKHADKNVVPGSHEDWCEEHQVPESQCTRCDPKLAAAFKATGDWCDEHNVPETQCLKCNPDLKIVRPAKK